MLGVSLITFLYYLVKPELTDSAILASQLAQGIFLWLYAEYWHYRQATIPT